MVRAEIVARRSPCDPGRLANSPSSPRLQAIEHFARPDTTSHTPVNESQDINITFATLHLGDEGLADLQALGDLDLRQPGRLATGDHRGAQGLVLRVIEGR